MRLLWTLAALALAYGVVVSLSRGGLLALVAGAVFVLWEFGVRGRRPHMVVLTFVLAGGLILASPADFGRRVESIFDASKDETGSGWARWALITKARNVALQNPVFGLGPGNFQTLEGTFWHGAHNTYAQLAAEAGFPALIFFLLILYKSSQNLRRIRKLDRYSPRTVLLAGALRANLACYAIGAFFSDTAFHFFPYLLMGYISVLHRLVMESEAPGMSERQTAAEAIGQQVEGNGPKQKLAWTAR
jgi:O-antigen ligase